MANRFPNQDALEQLPTTFNKTQCGNCDAATATASCEACQLMMCTDCLSAHQKMKIFKDHVVITPQKLKTQVTRLITAQTPLNCGLNTKSHFGGASNSNAQSGEQIKNILVPFTPGLGNGNHGAKDQDQGRRGTQVQQGTNNIDTQQENQYQEDEQAQDNGFEIEEAPRNDPVVEEHSQLEENGEQNALGQEINSEATGTSQQGAAADGRVEAHLQDNSLEIEQAPGNDLVVEEGPQEQTQPDKKDAQNNILLGQESNIEEQQAAQGCLKLVDCIPFSLNNYKLYIPEIEPVQESETQTIEVIVTSKRNLPFKQLEIEIKAELSDENNSNREECAVKRQGSSKYTFTYCPKTRGAKLHLTVQENQVPGSPLKLPVLPNFTQVKRYEKLSETPKGVAANNGRIVVLENSGNTVTIFQLEGGKHTFGSRGSDDGQLNYAYGVAVDKDNNIFVVDTDNHRIQKFNSEGGFIKKEGHYGSAQLQFHYPLGITYNHRDNHLYIADQRNNRIQVLTTDLEFVRSFGECGIGEGQLDRPHGVAVDATNAVYVTDYRNNRVQVYTATGGHLQSFKLNKPRGIAIDSNNFVYVSEEQISVAVFSSQGRFISTVKKCNCYGLAVDRDDTLIVSDVNEGCLHLY